MTTAPLLSSPRLDLRGPVLDDFATYRNIVGQPRSRFIGGPLSRDRAWEAFASDYFGWMIQGFGYWTVTLRSDNSVAGMVGLSKPPAYPELELGWILDQQAEGRGIAFEAALLVRDWAFANLGIKTLVSYIDQDNSRSIALAKRLDCNLDPNAAVPDPGDLVFRHPAPDSDGTPEAYA